MLDAFIIEQLKEEKVRKEEEERPELSIHLPDQEYGPIPEKEDEEGPERGVVIIEYGLNELYSHQ